MSAAIFYITKSGLALARKLTGLYPDTDVRKFSVDAVAEQWPQRKRLIFIMASGIVVRTIAPLIKDKKTDPAVVVLDEKGRFAVSLLSGHLGGANETAREIAEFLGGDAVITTASDVNGMTALDVWAQGNDLVIEDWGLVPKLGTRLINSGTLKVYSEVSGLRLPGDFQKAEDPSSADIVISHRERVHDSRQSRKQLYLRPRDLVVGIGCNSRTPAEEIENAVREVFGSRNLAFASIRSLATIEKKGSEPGLIAFAKKYNLSIAVFSAGKLNQVKGVAKSEAAFKATGAQAVAEPAALLASGGGRLVVEKQKTGNVTVAVAERKGRKELMDRKGKGRISIVGTGPGNADHITPYAQKAIRKADIVVGYDTYLELIRELIKGKEVFSTGMTRETDRCKKAVELALSGKTVAVISGGDPGIYAMAGLVLELLKGSNGPSLPVVEVIPGISALNACAARLGAPLMHDFASISLSDRLTEWDLIEKRLDAAAMADFVIILYNPKSKGRVEHIEQAREIILKHRSPQTPVGIVKGAMREDERVTITDLGSMLDHDIDMQTTVIIGNSRTFTWNNLMITPRGYENKK